MEPEIILIVVFALSLIFNRLRHKAYKFALSGRIAMSAMLLMTALGHFLFAKGMAMMLPDFIPLKMEAVYLTGILEIAAAIGLQLRKWRKLTGWLLIVFLILILPANIYAALNNVNIETATYDGEGIAYLWYRIPLQIFFILWVYLSSINTKSFLRRNFLVSRI